MSRDSSGGEGQRPDTPTYSAGVKDLASAYVLCPRLTEQLCLSIDGGRKHGKGLREGSRGIGAGKECGKTERWD